MSEVRSPAVGRVVELLVAAGDHVTAGQEIVIVESMKMEIPIAAETAGTVASLAVAVGAQVQAGDLLLVLAHA